MAVKEAVLYAAKVGEEQVYEMPAEEALVSFEFKGQAIINPFLDPTGRRDLSEEEARKLYGDEKFDAFVKECGELKNSGKRICPYFCESRGYLCNGDPYTTGCGLWERGEAEKHE